MMAPSITFDPEDEDYCLVPGRGRVRRWHKVARDAGLVEPISDLAYERVTNAKHRGRQVHEAIELFLKRQPLDVTMIHDEALPYVQAFIEYWDKHGHANVQAEAPQYCVELDFCTTPDFRTPGVVYEVKTASQPNRLWGLQSAAQMIACSALVRRVIWLRPKLKTRTFEILEFPDDRVFSEWDGDVVREACRGEYDGPAISAWKALR